ncbi:PGBD-like superfamily [Sesbania bispinosa]|nr:PGBD-like superfamily [Sesbania bispinosa]
MKSYLYTWLLFLLLVDKSVSRIPRSSSGNVKSGKIRGLGVHHYTWRHTVDNVEIKTLSPPQPIKKIQGLSQIKQYFSNFGYLQDSGPFDDYLDQNTISAIKTYQQYFNLPVTGKLDNDTSLHISLPRCAVPDMNFNYAFNENESWPKGKQWFPAGTKTLTYGFLPASNISRNEIQVFRDAFKRWSQTTRVMNLTETTYDKANIKIGFYNFSEGVDDALVGFSIIQSQPDSGVKTGEMRLDDTKYWVLPSDNYSWSFKEEQFDLETVAMHQIGHLLGLEHSSNEDSVMYPTILPSQQRKVLITDSDNKTVQQLYTNSGYGERFALFGSSVGLLTTLSLGFALLH